MTATDRGAGGPHRPGGARPVGQSMALLTELMEHPLDASYRDRARARREQGLPPAAGLRSPLLLLTCAVVGLLLAVASQTLRVPQEQAVRQRDQLVGQIEQKQRQNEAQRTANDRLREQNDAARRAAVSGPDKKDLAAALQRTELAAAAVPVRGPGMVLTLDDSGATRSGATGPARGGSPAEDALGSRDLQILVNGLWQAGADAVSINGHRLTSRSAIRFAGQAILVDFRPLARPYEVSAIGPPRLADDFAAGASGGYLDDLEEEIGLRATSRSVSSLTLPAAPEPVLHQARPQGDPGEGVVSPPSQEGTP